MSLLKANKIRKLLNIIMFVSSTANVMNIDSFAVEGRELTQGDGVSVLLETLPDILNPVDRNA